MIEKTLRLLMLLSGIKRYSRAEIKSVLNISERTVYRYLSILENAGFALEKNNGRYRLLQSNYNTKSLNNLIHFSEEEAYVFYRSIYGMNGAEHIKERLLNKLHSLYDFKALGKIKDQDQLEIVNTISKSIAKKQVLIFQQYRSSNSATISDREVEAFQFAEDYKSVWCYDIKDKTIKQFMLSRIGKVILLSKNWHNEANHQLPFTDAFRMAAPKPIDSVKLKLSLRAFNLICEEFPLAEKDITKQENSFELETKIASYYGIGRFILGLPGEIEILQSKKLKDFILKQIKTYKH